MTPLSRSTNLTITNPLVLYRTLVATHRIEADPAQHRLAIHLQKVYHRLKDYRPDPEIQQRLERIKNLGTARTAATDEGEPDRGKAESSSNFVSRWRGQAQNGSVTALTRRLTDHQAAAELDSPQGLLVHGQVGTGKSILIDLLADSLPNAFKARWHFSTLMLHIFQKLEDLRRSHLLGPTAKDFEADDYYLLTLAREMVSDSPVLFIDEFQFPDRASSKLLSHLFTSFFHLGGVLIATSNRMPDDLANAAGIDFSVPNPAGISMVNRGLSLLGWTSEQSNNDGTKSSGDFDMFLKVLKARCEIWEMEGQRDWRRRDSPQESCAEPYHQTSSPQKPRNDNDPLVDEPTNMTEKPNADATIPKSPSHWVVAGESRDTQSLDREVDARTLPYLVDDDDRMAVKRWDWSSTQIRVYGRDVSVHRQDSGYSKWTFEELCCMNFGPADYVSLASKYHTFILTGVPSLTNDHKNEARRFITFLDAAYEARCRLLIAAAAGPDEIFFSRSVNTGMNTSEILERGDAIGGSDASVYSETFSEIYQDQTLPFRPNTSVYISSASPPSYAASSLPTSASQLSHVRSILADEDSDFGPVFGANHSPLSPKADAKTNHGQAARSGDLDFGRTGAFVGQDERFAYKRAESRLWEMCSDRWWSRKGDWWRPLSERNRPWERPSCVSNAPTTEVVQSDHKAAAHSEEILDSTSPFRTRRDSPPKFSLMHAWGLGLWGKRAGTWGRGAEARGERNGQGD